MMKPAALIPLGLRIGLGALFFFSGFTKLLESYSTFLNVVLGYKIVGGEIALAATFILPWTELVAGAFLFLGLWTRASAALLWMLNSLFIAAISSVLWRGMDLEHCGCFGESVLSLSPRQVIGLDIFLWFCFLTVILRPREANRFSLDGFFKNSGA